ncbi:uncharacterized protein AC631_02718 [Debaryomyces fabryi]|uniref:AB hydrolase-1 domain-containing protein n=1 Tax=Debaryomyces fabryi TaxID=58627 RepID=A0A0V1PZ54_9ASCO|nr:uncharacterized protein AC631_02718 [Debaryomyces fabryi]KSA01497.1 hypothetical protein AC631_02718 [Debaryomyces fabryi]CUM52215.1 unnamed protein product [Debaryomyces fabryi]
MLVRPTSLFTSLKILPRVNKPTSWLGFKNYSTKSNIHYDGTQSSYASNPASYLGDALATDGSIETVDLVYDKHSPQEEPSVTKSPLIILHGLFGSKINNRTVAKKLATRLERDVYCLDLRNFGQSPHINRLDYPSLSADVENFIEQAKFPESAKPIIIGHSMGAKTVMALALRRPDLPKMVVSVDNAPVDLTMNSVSSFAKYVRQLRIALEQYKYTNIKDVDAQLAKVEPSKEVRQFLITNLHRGKTNDVITSKVPLEIINKAITGGYISGWPYDLNVSRWSKGPMLVIRGTQSSYVPDEIIPDIGKYFPNFDVRDVDSGHWVISEKPTEFMEILVDFIEKNEDEEF